MRTFHTFLIALITIVPAHRDVEGDSAITNVKLSTIFVNSSKSGPVSG